MEMSRTIDSVLLNMEDNVNNANTVRDLVIGKLLEDKAINKETADNYMNNWQVIVIKNSWFKRIFSGEGWRYVFVKLK